MNTNPIGSLLLLGLLLLSGFAIAAAEGAKRKSLTVLVIIAFMAAGVGIGAGLGAWGGNMEIGGHLAAPLMIWLGIAGALGMLRRNRRQRTTTTAPTK